ncbi:UDP-N-acetylglucosamine 4,6-dehydratase [Winogradskyella psychrotolerans]|uniref:UDP-N-acetylglucosamine 4,6-dehydratase n=1 Tax=Winogradskyella psychrotolerans TaxID=1344585 RepID=UPI001C0769A6|nr:UDP-N-acetylglucosamine 4,6-dehydratase [Winogradskyella psychrotolerans]MBU2928978.1 UDP-N-acetylglucosamine 4,6-dehydratase [Winogradskyella psychrotolerans]
MNHNNISKQHILNLIDRETELFERDLATYNSELNATVASSKFLVLGAAGTIGQAVTKEIFKRQPKKLHIVDISENNLAELVRDLRSSFGYIYGDFKTFALDIGSVEYDAFIASDGNYDYVLNLSALKHVRSEEDAFTLMRMIDVNIFNTEKTIQQSIENGVKKYFCVSTDKATNPVSMMGASKRIMELFLMQNSKDISISTARFANVAFSDGSLLYSFEQRIKKQQPIVAPNDIKRYFMTPKESGELCLLSCILGENNDIFFPQLKENLNLTSFADIAINYLSAFGYEPYLCDTENEARQLVKTLPQTGQWPYLITKSDTTGEKESESFFTKQDTLDLKRFDGLGIIKNQLEINTENKLNHFSNAIKDLKANKSWTKENIIDLFHKILPNFNHQETGKYLDHKM